MRDLEERDQAEQANTEELWELAQQHQSGTTGDCMYSQAHMDTDPLEKSNRELAEHICLQVPRYNWRNPEDENCAKVRFPRMPPGVRLQRRGTHHVPGRGQVSTAFAYPPHYAELVLWWLNEITWSTPVNCEPPNSSNNTTTMLECVVDMEMSTGFRLDAEGLISSDWASKAKALAHIIRTLARVHGVEAGAGKTTLRAARPQTEMAISKHTCCRGS